jgi:hypothetical protein
MRLSHLCTLAFISFTVLGCAHAPPYDPNYLGIKESVSPQGPLFYSDGQIEFFGNAAQSLFNDMKAPARTLPNGNTVKPAHPKEDQLQCAQLKDSRKADAWFYVCTEGVHHLIRTHRK